MNAVIEQAIISRLHTLDNQKLAEVLDFVEFIALQNKQKPAADTPLVHSLRGKYRNLMTPSTEFAKRKQEEINLEDAGFLGNQGE